MGILFGAKNDTDQFLWDLVCRKLKNQTRRAINPGDYMPAMSKVARATVLTAKDRVRFAVGQQHAVQPKMSKPCVWYNPSVSGDYAHTQPNGDKSLWDSIVAANGRPEIYMTEYGYRPARIEIVDLWREDVRDISDSDARAEGFSGRLGFWLCWVKCYSPRNYKRLSVLNEEVVSHNLRFGPYASINWMSWALSFKLVVA